MISSLTVRESDLCGSTMQLTTTTSSSTTLSSPAPTQDHRLHSSAQQGGPGD